MRYQPQHEYQEFTIDSLAELHAVVSEYSAYHKLSSDPIAGETYMFQAFFRGQGDAKWDIAPSLLHAQEKM